MKKLFTLFFSMMTSLSLLAQEAAEKGIDEQIDEKFGEYTGWFVEIVFYKIPFTEDIQVYWVLFPLILGAAYFTVYFKFINFRGFFTSVNIVRGNTTRLTIMIPTKLQEILLLEEML
jgi:AGCS family alanine or glycine:cation symporter